MGRISRLLEAAGEPLGVRAIRDAVTGQTKHKTQALKFLVDDGYVAPEPGPRNAVLHRSIKPFRQAVEPTDYEALAAPPP